MSERSMLSLDGVRKSYHDGEGEVRVLDGIDFELDGGESVALTGASGCGKSTFLQIAAGLDRPDAGVVSLLGKDVSGLSERDLALLRRRSLGFVFQQFNLLPGLSARDNVLFQRRLNGLPDDDAWVTRLVQSLGIEPLLARRVEKLSGGEQQRVAIARALAHRPDLVFADEPTGNLNDALSDDVAGLLRELVDEAGCALLIVTHSRRLAVTAARRLILRGGHLHAADANTA